MINIDQNKNVKINTFIEWLIYMIGYTIAFLIVSSIFKTFEINEEHTYLYAFISVLLIYILNKTVKPILFILTLPITGITLGLFYFVINSIILKLTDLIMGDKLNFTSVWILFFIAIVLSITNLLIEGLIIKPIIKRFKRHG